MKSKEQILNEQTPLTIDGVNYITWEQAIEAMEKYSKQLHKPIVGRSLPTDEAINDMVMWLDKRCAFDDHQKDYVFFGLKQMSKKVMGQ